MRKVGTIVMVVVMVAVFSYGAEACDAIPESGFTIDGISGLNAAIVNPGTVNSLDVDAKGCDIAIYYSPGTTGLVEYSQIHGAIMAGVVNNHANVPIKFSSIYQIGDSPLDGVQYGLGIYVYGLGSGPYVAKGDITNNTLWNYQKNGIVVKGGTVNVLNNTLIGQGPVSFIAQNGVEVAYGSVGSIKNNIIFGHSYTGPANASSGGVLLIGGACFGQTIQANTVVENNVLEGNDVGVWSANLAADCIHSVTTPTNNKISNNDIRYNGIFNTSGGPLVSGGTEPYQAGVSDQGVKDIIQNNSICGLGYTAVGDSIFSVDISLAISPKVSGNNCH